MKEDFPSGMIKTGLNIKFFLSFLIIPGFLISFLIKIDEFSLKKNSININRAIKMR